jgi:26S proteasome regulatory subunit T1
MLSLSITTKAISRTACSSQYAIRQYAHLSRIPARTPHELAILMEEWSNRPPRPLALNKFLSFASSLSSESILASAEYTVSELPRRLIKRIQAFESLPYIVGTNPFIENILNGYRESFQALASHPFVETTEQNIAFIDKLRLLVGRHANDIATMAKGFQECTRYMSPTQIAAFLDSTIGARIAIRLIAEQHLAISEEFSRDAPKEHLGVVDLRCSPQRMIKMCGAYVTELCDGTFGSSPPLKIEGDADATFAYVQLYPLPLFRLSRLDMSQSILNTYLLRSSRIPSEQTSSANMR